MSKLSMKHRWCSQKSKDTKRVKRFKAFIKKRSPFTALSKRRLLSNLMMWLWRKRGRLRPIFWKYKPKKRVKCLFRLTPLLNPNIKIRSQTQNGIAERNIQKHPSKIDRLQRQALRVADSCGIRGSCGKEQRLNKDGCVQELCLGKRGVSADQNTSQSKEKANSAKWYEHLVTKIDLHSQSTDRYISEEMDCETGLNNFERRGDRKLCDHICPKDCATDAQLQKHGTNGKARKEMVISEVVKYQAAVVSRAVPSFRVVYKKHTLTMEDLSTLADNNWLNDQVINMYGELIMDSSDHMVHFLNSFFHHQLETKGYEGVKRWTKRVNLFTKRLLLAPIHLEVHWCLVTVAPANKRVQLYDSQCDPPQEVAMDILKYLTTEAKEKLQTSFQTGWAVCANMNTPQQTNENDCGVFVLECCKRLALGKPLMFSQKAIPNIRKRIYKELCEQRLVM